MKSSIQRYIRIFKQMLKTRLGSRSWLDNATYYADAMATWGKAGSFLRSDKFWKAYHRGENSGHHLSGGQHLHIEWRVHIALSMAIHAKNLPGDFVECGVNTGITSLAICDYLNFNTINKRFFLFDTYCGIPEDQMTPEEIASGRRAESAQLYSECYEATKKNFSAFPNAILVRGRVPETLNTLDIDRVCYLHLDMNIAKPEIAALQYFWDRLTVGAPILLDDFGWDGFAEQREAIGGVAHSHCCEVCELPTGQGLFFKS